MSVRCGNRTAHGDDRVYHSTSADVRDCYATPVRQLAQELWPATAAEADTETCEHGMAAWLCADPVTHYPSDEQMGGGRMATESEAHAEWHRNAGVPMGQPGCPQDACHPLEYDEPETPASGLLYDGIFTVETEGGHRTFRVRTQGADEDFAPGKTVIAYLSGPDNSRDYTNFGFVTHDDAQSYVKVWSRFAGNADLRRDAEALVIDPEGALKVAHCSRCHRKLTVPTSVYAGVGPECAKKGI